jgi:hypothetical protein
MDSNNTETSLDQSNETNHATTEVPHNPPQTEYPKIDYENHAKEEHKDFPIQLTESVIIRPTDNVPVVIKVCEPTVKDETFSKHVIYKVKGTDRDGAYESFRRYSDFNTLRKVMQQRWPGCYIPPLPEKKAIGNLDLKFIEDRRKFLEYFCQKIAEIPYLYYAEEFQIFIRSNSHDIEKALNPLSIVVYEDIINKYGQAFRQLAGKELTSEASARLATFTGYLRKVVIMFESFKSISKGFAASKKKVNETFNTFHHKLMIEYENLCLLEYSQGKEDHTVFKNNNQLNLTADQINQDPHSLEGIHEFLKFEDKEIKAMLEALSWREKYEGLKLKVIEKKKNETQEYQNVIAGKTTLKSMLSSITQKTKEEQTSHLEKSIANCTKDVDHVTLIHEMITLIIALHEIEKFKAEKLQRYYDIIKLVAGMQAGNAKLFEEYWTTLLQLENIAKSHPVSI